MVARYAITDFSKFLLFSNLFGYIKHIHVWQEIPFFTLLFYFCHSGLLEHAQQPIVTPREHVLSVLTKIHQTREEEEVGQGKGCMHGRQLRQADKCRRDITLPNNLHLHHARDGHYIHGRSRWMGAVFFPCVFTMYNDL